MPAASTMAEFSSRLHASLAAQTAVAKEAMELEKKRKNMHKKAELALAKEKQLVSVFVRGVLMIGI